MDNQRTLTWIWGFFAGWCRSCRGTLCHGINITNWCQFSVSELQEEKEILPYFGFELEEDITEIPENTEKETNSAKEEVGVCIPPKLVSYYNEIAICDLDQPDENASQPQAATAPEETIEPAVDNVVRTLPVDAQQLQVVGAHLEIEESIQPCIASFAPGAQDCTWQSTWRNMYLHLVAEHKGHLVHAPQVVLEPTKYKIMYCYNAFFLCYVTFHHRDLICVVQHACPCNTDYAYRCMLISQDSEKTHLSSHIRLALNELKDFKLLRKHPRVTRFRNSDVEPRKDSNKRISVWIRIFHPSSITEAPSRGSILLLDTEDLPHNSRNVECASNERQKMECIVSQLRLQCHGNNPRSDMDLLLLESASSISRNAMMGQKTIQCPIKCVPGTPMCNWFESREFLFVHMMKVHEQEMQHTNNVVLEPTKYKILHLFNEIFVCYIAHDNKDIVCVVLRASSSSIPYLYRCCLISVSQDLPHAISEGYGVLNRAQEHRIVRKLSSIVRFKQSDLRERKFSDNRTSILFEIYMPTGTPRINTTQLAEEGATPLVICALNETHPTGGCPWIGSRSSLWEHLSEEHRAYSSESDAIVLQPMHCGVLRKLQHEYICYCTYAQDELVCTMWSKIPCHYKCSLLSGTEVPAMETSTVCSQQWYNALKLIINSQHVTRFSADAVEQRRSAKKVIEVKFEIISLLPQQPRWITREDKENMKVWCILNDERDTGPCQWKGLWKSYLQHLRRQHVEGDHQYCILTHLMKPKVLYAYGDVFICYTTMFEDNLTCRIHHACPCEVRYPYRVTLISGDRKIPDFSTGIMAIETKNKTFQQIHDTPIEVHFEADAVRIRSDDKGKIFVLVEVFSPDIDKNHPSCCRKEEEQGAIV